MTGKPEPRRATPGQIAAAKLLLKREREGKVTIEITERIREIAAQDPERVRSLALEAGCAKKAKSG